VIGYVAFRSNGRTPVLNHFMRAGSADRTLCNRYTVDHPGMLSESEAEIHVVRVCKVCETTAARI
jgi:hypothetical protein